MSLNQPIKKVVKYGKPSSKLLNSRLKQEQDIKTQRNKLALSSVKDIFSILNPNADNDEDFDLTDFDCKVYFANPKAFDKLPYFKKVHVITEMNEKLKKNWKSIDQDIKRFSVWWAYGSHGPRDGFVELHDYLTPYGIENYEEIKQEPVKKNIKKQSELDNIIQNISNETVDSSSALNRSALQMSSNVVDSLQINKRPEVPPDLPFKLPSILSTFKPNKNTKIHKLPDLDPRSFGLKRVQQYRQDRKMNPVNRLVIFSCILLTVLCFKQDRRVNVTGKAPEYPWEVAEREERELEEAKVKAELEEFQKIEAENLRQEEELKNKRRRKWYYLWLK